MRSIFTRDNNGNKSRTISESAVYFSFVCSYLSVSEDQDN